jgi:ascorbate-specific PTS system EIIC-type component UlaA
LPAGELRTPIVAVLSNQPAMAVMYLESMFLVVAMVMTPRHCCICSVAKVMTAASSIAIGHSGRLQTQLLRHAAQLHSEATEQMQRHNQHCSMH